MSFENLCGFSGYVFMDFDYYSQTVDTLKITMAQVMHKEGDMVHAKRSKTLIVRHLPSELTRNEKEDLLKYFGAVSARVFSDKGRLGNVKVNGVLQGVLCSFLQGNVKVNGVLQGVLCSNK
ncbi:UNVERIFIED_CONTAM: hypothetical protein FKN15_052597 [Acipenser sinensis]